MCSFHYVMQLIISSLNDIWLHALDFTLYVVVSLHVYRCSDVANRRIMVCRARDRKLHIFFNDNCVGFEVGYLSQSLSFLTRNHHHCMT